MASELTIQLLRSNPRVIVAVAGEVDLSTAPRLSYALARASRTGRELLVDLERVEFMDCAGLRVLMEWAGDEGGNRSARLAVTPGSRQVQRLFEMTGADRVLRVISPVPFEMRSAA